MLRKGSSAAPRNEEDNASIGSTSEKRSFPNGETLVIPIGDSNNNNTSLPPPPSAQSTSSSKHSHAGEGGTNYPPPQSQFNHYGAPPPHHYSHPNHGPPPQQGYGGYYYDHHPHNPHNNNNNNNSINYKVVAVAVLSLMAVLHLTRPQTAIIQIDPNGGVLRHAVNGNGQQQMFMLENKNGVYSAVPAASGGGNGGAFSGQVGDAVQQQHMGVETSSASLSSFTSNNDVVPSTGTTMEAEMATTTEGEVSSSTYGADDTVSTTMAEGMEEAVAPTIENGQGEEAAAFGEETTSFVENEDTSVGLYGETAEPENTLTDIAETPVVGEDGRLPGTLPGTGQVDLSLSNLDHFKDAWDPYEPSDNAVFWHIPKAGGSTVKDVIGTCHRFVMATEFGVTDGHENDPEIAVVYPGGGPVGQDRSPFVNVDTTTIEGIERAKQMGFADSGLADAVVTPFIYEANELFTPTAKGRLFTVFRHPIDRAISLFYYIQVADWEPTYNPDLVNWSIEQYAQSDIIENNWMTRQLTNQLEGDLNDDHLALAMEVIRRKFLVGLMTQIERTVERFERFFRWTYHVNPPNQEACRERLLQGGSNKNASGNKKEKPQEGSEAYELLRMQNNYDLQLFEYIESLFEEQEEFVQDIPADFRNIDATCCKCFPPTFPPEGFNCPLAILN